MLRFCIFHALVNLANLFKRTLAHYPWRASIQSGESKDLPVLALVLEQVELGTNGQHVAKRESAVAEGVGAVQGERLRYRETIHETRASWTAQPLPQDKRIPELF